MDYNNNIVLADFGLSKELKFKTYTPIGTICNMAPELFFIEKEYEKKANYRIKKR